MSYYRCSLLFTSLYTIMYLCDFVNSVNHCQSHRYYESINSTIMQFTKEAVSQEYAVLGEFKMLHCCAKGYTSIEWYVES